MKKAKPRKEGEPRVTSHMVAKKVARPPRPEEEETATAKTLSVQSIPPNQTGCLSTSVAGVRAWTKLARDKHTSSNSFPGV